MEINYAFIKDGEVINIAVFDDPSDTLLEIFKQEYSLDYLIPTDHKTQIGGTYDGTVFWKIKPFPSWIKNEVTKDWVPPIEPPDKDKTYIWNEDLIIWEETQVGPAVEPE